jgi:RNA polymerase sigma factor (TIGR02999 family)
LADENQISPNECSFSGPRLQESFGCRQVFLQKSAIPYRTGSTNNYADMKQPPDPVATLLAEMAEGDTAAAEKLFSIVYEELHALAAKYMQRERGNHTLQATALVHEAFLRLVGTPSSTAAHYQDVNHFVATAAIVMRRILVNHAKAKKADKRGGEFTQSQLADYVDEFERSSIDLIALDDALDRLKAIDHTQFRLIELRFFGGMTNEQCAEILQISPRTAHYEWAHAKAWLRDQLEEA